MPEATKVCPTLDGASGVSPPSTQCDSGSVGKGGTSSNYRVLQAGGGRTGLHTHILHLVKGSVTTTTGQYVGQMENSEGHGETEVGTSHTHLGQLVSKSMMYFIPQSSGQISISEGQDLAAVVVVVVVEVAST
ncbi:hypothetical protein E2C01_006946 [Portunus trituberculatus]|uniref:Uncharacterized protein n=1 Tax=Portunus trituberculatus TaxID=210409 RepID=A0A5B7CWH7_PORTR|nr:hypothetical protein [Portunus trituberculatus]